MVAANMTELAAGSHKRSFASFLACERARDEAECGFCLAEDSSTAYASEGAHDPTASHYFVLDDLFSRLRLSDSSRVLDVGCGAGRVLAFYARRGMPGCIDGVELDPVLAERAQKATAGFTCVRVFAENVLNISLAEYTHCYLFNPFDSWVLERFVEKLERETSRVTLCHMSDNGEGYFFMGRPGWRLDDEGSFKECEGVAVFDYPQHWSIWEYAKPTG